MSRRALSPTGFAVALVAVSSCARTPAPTAVRAARSAPTASVSSSAPAPSAAPLQPAPSVEVAAAPPPVPVEIGPRLPSGLGNPLPGGTLSGYVGDTGLDIASAPHAVYAIAAGSVEYAEAGHTRWVGKNDTPLCVRIRFDQPIVRNGRKITHAYYAHLSALAFEQAEGAPNPRHVELGERLGTSGVARGLPHLHLGLLLDGDVSQTTFTNLLREDEVRAVLGVGKTGTKLPGS